MNKYYLYMILAVVISSCSQIILKSSAGEKHDSLWKEYLNVKVIAGYAMMVVSTLLMIAAYQGVDFKNGPIIESLGYIFVLILSFLIFHEKVGRKKLLGYLLILAGVVVFYL